MDKEYGEVIIFDMDMILTYIMVIALVVYFLYRLFWGSQTIFTLINRDTDKALDYTGKSTNWFAFVLLLIALLIVLYLKYV